MMVVFLMAVLAVIAAPLAEGTPMPPPQPRVVVNEGTLVGYTTRFTEDTFLNVDKNIDMFLGVPYAEPPTRFTAPSPKTPWQGDYEATNLQNACQQDSPPDPSLGMSEDCLYLNVFTPSPKPQNAAVMVWIHGGGFAEGSAMSHAYTGAPLVAVGDVIVITINYRLGIFAQFTTKDEEAPGNFGMLDQVAALRWVYDNIEAFGGDRGRITIFGESAGGASVDFHLLSKLSRGYFSQAIMQSGSALAHWAFEDKPEEEMDKARRLATELNCDVTNSSVLVTCLRSKDAETLHAAANEVYSYHFPVTLDGTFLEDTPTNLYVNDDVKRVTLMSGSTRDEGTFLAVYGLMDPPPHSFDYFQGYISASLLDGGLDFAGSVELTLQEYTDWTIVDDPDADHFQSTAEFVTDTMIACPENTVIRHHANMGDTVYQYQMSYVPSRHIFSLVFPNMDLSWLGAGHADDDPLVFGWAFNDILVTYAGWQVSDEDKTMSAVFMKYWTNFAKSGDPSKPSPESPAGEGPDTWPTYTLPEMQYKELDLDLSVKRALKARKCGFWSTYYPEALEFIAAVEANARNTTLLECEDDDNDDNEGWKANFKEWKKEFGEYLKKQKKRNPGRNRQTD